MGYEGMRAVIGAKWTLELLDLLDRKGPLHYTEIESELPTSSDVVSDRLTLLRTKGFLDRQERSPKDVIYEITTDGEKLLREVQRLQSSYDF